MRRKGYRAWLTAFCLCMIILNVSCGIFSGVEPENSEELSGEKQQEAADRETMSGEEESGIYGQGNMSVEEESGTFGQENMSGEEESGTYGQENMSGEEKKTDGLASVMAADRIAEVNALAAYSIVDVADWEPAAVHELFFAQEIPDEIYTRINGCSYRQNEHIDLEELRYLRVLHMGFDGKTHVGELIVNQAVSEDILEIMEALYEADYPIERMVLVDDYDGDDERSMDDNNTSAFNYRTIAGTDRLSNHSFGMAIDINPRYNPYVKVKSDGSLLVSPQSGQAYADREADFPYKIERDGLCYRLFAEHGFAWGGDWNSIKDYQHFEKEW